MTVTLSSSLEAMRFVFFLYLDVVHIIVISVDELTEKLNSDSHEGALFKTQSKSMFSKHLKHGFDVTDMLFLVGDLDDDMVYVALEMLNIGENTIHYHLKHCF